MTDDQEPRKYSEEQQKELRRQLLDIVSAERMTKKALSDQVGVPYGTFSSWLGGTYQADGSSIADKARNWLDARPERERFRVIRPSTRFVLTPTAEAVHQRLFYAHNLPDIVPIVGEPGLGKTEAIRDYAAKDPHVYVITAEPAMDKISVMLSAIALAVGAYQNGRSYMTSRSIAKKLQEKPSLIIIDDAQHFTSEMLDQLRTYYDQCRCGIALVGNRGILKNLEGGSRRAEYAHLFRRAGLRLNRMKPETQDVTMLLDAWGVEDQAIRKRLRAIAHQPGALGVMHKIWSIAELMARGEDRPLTLTDVEDAYQQSTDQPSRDAA